jgi:hypothetical protein
MNKRADISIIILVLGVVAVCSLAILSFYSSKISVENDFIGLGIIEKINSFAEEVKFHQNPIEMMEVFTQGISQDSVVFKGTNGGKDKKEVYSITGNYFVEECEYWLVGCEDKRMIFVEYKFIQNNKDF